MKGTLVPLLAVCFCVHNLDAQPQPPQPLTPRLSGIISLPGTKRAILETAEPTVRPGDRHVWQRAGQWVLGEGERQGDVEVIEIHPEAGFVKLHLHGAAETLTLTNRSTRPEGTAPAIQLECAALNPVLSIYSQVANRTLLRHPLLPKADFTVTGVATNLAEAALVLRSALAAKDIAAIDDGEKFILVVPKQNVSEARPHSSEVISSALSRTNTEAFPPGLVDFRGADINQVADIYATLIGRKLDRSERLPARGATSIYLTTQTSVSKEEILYALDTIFGWADLKFVRVGEDLVKVVPVKSSSR